MRLARLPLWVLCLAASPLGAHEGPSSTARTLSAAGAARLESRLEKEPGDVDARAILTAYYMRHRRLDGTRDRLDAHRLWLIEHQPDQPILHRAVRHGFEPAAERRAAALFREHLSRAPRDADALWNAAAFFSRRDTAEAERLLRAGQGQASDDRRWSAALGLFYERRYRDVAPADRGDLARRALAAYERALPLGGERGLALRAAAAMAAFEAGDSARAAAHAADLLAAAESDVSRHARGRAVHEAHQVLGLVALRGGRLDQATRHLALAADAPGWPHLDEGRGLRLALARALLMEGRRDAVLDYIAGGDRKYRQPARRWEPLIRAGKLPRGWEWR